MMKPIRIFYSMLLMALFVPTSLSAQTPTDDKFVVSDLTYHSSSGLYYFDVSLSGSRIYTAYNLDILFPEGIDVAMNGEIYRVIMLKSSFYPSTYDDIMDETTYTHTVTSAMPSEHLLRIACTSDGNGEFTANTGNLFRVFVNLDASKFTFSPKPLITISGGNLTTKAAVKYVPADYSCRPFTTGIPAERTLPINISSTNKVGTLILPFDAAIPSGVKAYTCSETSGEDLTLVSVDAFAACTPYIVYAENGYSGNITGSVDLSADFGTEDAFTSGYLTGVLSPTVVNTGYILQNQGYGPMFYDAEGASFSLPAGRCYLSQISSSVKAFGFNFDDATGIEEINSLPSGKNQGETYDLTGRKVSAPTKGFYIRDNMKVYIK